MPAGIFVILMNMCEVVKVWSLVAWLEAASQKVELPRAVFPSLLGYMVCPFGCVALCLAATAQKRQRTGN